MRWIFRTVSTIVFFVLVCSSLAFADSMSSSNYKITSDSLNVGGGNSVSSGYIDEGTVGEIATGNSTSTSYGVEAGYEQMTSSSISITSGSNVTLSPDINGVTGGTATGQTAWTVTTDDEAGYSLSIQASTNPALGGPGGASFADYSPGGTPSFNFTFSSSASVFGFSPEGSDIVERFRDNGSTCNTGSSDTANACWDGLSVAGEQIAGNTSNNNPSGTQTTVKFKAGIGASHVQDAGTYTASVTVTAVAL